MKRGVILVGHGSPPRDAPRALVGRLRALERELPHHPPASNPAPGTAAAEHLALDRELRRWPRTAENDPYAAGVEALASRLRARVAPARLLVAYNEFCAPTIGEALETLIAEGCTAITLVTTMLTPGGSHAEVDIPNAIDEVRRAHPGVAITYAWPVDQDAVADLLAREVR